MVLFHFLIIFLVLRGLGSRHLLLFNFK